jgi:hypothetical protein
LSKGDDMQVATADQDLRIARPAVVLRLGGSAVISRRHQRPVDDPGMTAIDVGLRCA